MSDNQQRTYIAIDLKSFFASVECVERGLDPLTTHLVVADKSRTEKTICLAVSPSLKAYGLPGRARLFEIVEKVTAINAQRKLRASNHSFTGSSIDALELQENPNLELQYITAVPRMSYYIKYSTRIFNIYLKYISHEDIHVYSIDEVFMDVTNYLKTYKTTALELTKKIILDVLQQTGITATAGIGTNLYLCKVAMDIVAKHVQADQDGVRIAELDEMSYRQQLWDHTPLTDFWRVGRGTAKKLAQYGIYTMGDLAQCSLENDAFLHRLFGVSAELLIDHAWGWEPCGMEHIKAYKPETNSFSTGQVLTRPYDFAQARVVVQEMADSIALNLVDKEMVTDQVILTVNYDAECLTNPAIRSKYDGDYTTDYYGRQVPKHAHGTANLHRHTSSSKIIIEAIVSLYNDIVNPNLLIRRLNISTNHVIPESQVGKQSLQLDLFSDENQDNTNPDIAKEKNIQQTILNIKKKYGKNAILKGLNYKDGATAKERNEQIGGHKA